MRDEDLRPSRPLDGVLVVAMEQAVAAPLATMRLAEAGARVVKIERPGGDFARGYDVAADGLSSYFAWLNRGKESIVLDLSTNADRALLARMVAEADVFVQNLAVGASARLGFGADALRAEHPGLIVCDLSGYGPDGPYADMKAYDLLVQAESGLLSVSGPPGDYGRIGVSVVDIGTGMNAAIAITQALVRKFRTGEGAHLQASLFESMADWMTVPLLHHDVLGAAPKRVGLAHPSIAPYGGFVTADGETVLISVQSDAEWRVLCSDVLGQPELGTDERFATNTARVANRPATDGLVSEAFATRSTPEVEGMLRSCRIAFGRVNDVAALSVHPQLRRTTVTHGFGSTSMPASPVRTDWLPADGPALHVPAVDEHGPALRSEFA